MLKKYTRNVQEHSLENKEVGLGLDLSEIASRGVDCSLHHDVIKRYITYGKQGEPHFTPLNRLHSTGQALYDIATGQARQAGLTMAREFGFSYFYFSA